MINSVTPNYPAALAGLKSGDVIVEFAGQPIESKDDFQEVVQQSQIGQPLPLLVLRDGDRVELVIELVERPQ